MQEQDSKNPDQPGESEAAGQELYRTTLRITPNEREQIRSMGKLLKKWGFTERDSLNTTVRYAITLLKTLIKTGIRWRQWLEEEHPEQAGA